MTLDTIVHADLFDLAATLDPASVDMILCDLPYGTTACSWDTVIPFEPMWAAFKRVIKPRGAIVLTASQPFTSRLVCSNLGMFKYSWFWNKVTPTGFISAKCQPMRQVEDVLVFSLGGANNGNRIPMVYYPQGLKQSNAIKTNSTTAGGLTLRDGGHVGPNNALNRNITYLQEWEHYPSNLLTIPRDSYKIHPTQKPVALFEYLIRTYTQPGELVFDPCVGSGTTAIAARKCGRHFICGDSSAEYVKVANDRLQNTDPFQDRRVGESVVQHSLFAEAAYAVS